MKTFLTTASHKQIRFRGYSIENFAVYQTALGVVGARARIIAIREPNLIFDITER